MFKKQNKASSRNKQLVLTAGLSATLAFFALTQWCGQPAWADSASDSLTKLEDHFFQHTYPTDTEEERLTRIEKLVFGEAKTGDDSARLADLQKVVADADATPAGTSGSSAGGNNNTIGGASGDSNSIGNSGDTRSNISAADSAALASTDYPRVDELEQLIFGQKYKQMPLASRLSQLETKAFGRPSKDDDLSARTDKLEQYWEKTLSPNVERQYLSAVEWLENKVIGQTYNSKPLIERVQTLEGIVFANQPPDTNAGIKEQLDTLTNAVHLTKGTGPGVTAMGGDSDSGRSANYPGQSSHSYPGQSAQSQYNSQQQYGINHASQASQAPQAPPAYPSNYQTSYNPGPGFHMPSQQNLQNLGQPEAYTAQPAYGQQGAYQQQNYQQAAYQPPAYEPAQAAQGYQPAPAEQYNQSGQATENSTTASAAQHQQNNGHPLLRGLAKALGAAATMAAGSMSSGMMNFNTGGYNNYGGSMYNGGGYGGYGGGYGGYNNGMGIHF